MKPPLPALWRSRTPAAFSLVELLVTVGILLLLASLTLSVTSAVQENARRARCIGNLRQIATAFITYLNENNNTLPQRFYPAYPPLGYDDLLLPYLNGQQKVFLCPSRPNASFPREPSYGMNWYYDNANAALVDKPSSTILVAETDRGFGGSHRADRDSITPGVIDRQRHQGKAHYIFFDGHVDRLDYDETRLPFDLWGTDQGHHSEEPPSAYFN